MAHIVGATSSSATSTWAGSRRPARIEIPHRCGLRQTISGQEKEVYVNGLIAERR
ncbi:hypothetical protein ABZ860_10270 [Microbispora sp. NPDC046973]|uniref:hypothetical protein n=1 Tax=Microbispora sp. NPDC046973 TaxID=3155022 RepID=UPI0034061063